MNNTTQPENPEDYLTFLNSLGGREIGIDVIEKLTQLSLDHRDPLTGMLDYRSFCHHAGKALKGAGDSTIMAISIDFLHELNIIKGHVIGDIIICQTASLIRHVLTDNFICGRTGGPTFTILIPGKNEAFGRRLFRGLRKTMATLSIAGIECLPHKEITMSAGMYSCNDDITIESALSEVMRRLAHAQQHDGNRLSLVAEHHPIEAHHLSENIQVILNYEDISLNSSLKEIAPHFITVHCHELIRLHTQIELTLRFNDDITHQTDAEVIWRQSQSERGYLYGLFFITPEASFTEAIETGISKAFHGLEKADKRDNSY